MLSSAVRKNGEACAISRSSPRSPKPASAWPGAKPARQHHARLRPAEHPREWRAGPRCASELLREAGREPIFSVAISCTGVICRKNVVKPGVPYTSARYCRNASAESADIAATERGSRLGRAAVVLQRGQQRRRGNGLEVRRRTLRRAVLGGDHLALLGDAQPSLHGARRLRADGRERRAAAATHGPATAVEDLHAHAQPRRTRRPARAWRGSGSTPT